MKIKAYLLKNDDEYYFIEIKREKVLTTPLQTTATLFFDIEIIKKFQKVLEMQYRCEFKITRL